MFSTEVSTETEARLNETVNSVKQILYVLATAQTIGDRILEAFETDDKAFIAEKLGFSSVQAVYKVLKGERELDFEKLQRFRNYTQCSIDWLLTGKGPKFVNGDRSFDLERSVEIHDDWHDVLSEWFKFEGREMPETLGASFMGGWSRSSKEERIEAIRDFKKLLDMIADDAVK